MDEGLELWKFTPIDGTQVLTNGLHHLRYSSRTRTSVTSHKIPSHHYCFSTFLTRGKLRKVILVAFVLVLNRALHRGLVLILKLQ